MIKIKDMVKSFHKLCAHHVARYTPVAIHYIVQNIHLGTSPLHEHGVIFLIYIRVVLITNTIILCFFYHDHACNHIHYSVGLCLNITDKHHDKDLFNFLFPKTITGCLS